MALSLTAFQTPASEIRGQVDSIAQTQQKLETRGAAFLSSYEFTDFTYSPTGSAFSNEYWRIRHCHKTNWEQKPVNLTHKVRPLEEGARLSKVFYQEYDTVDEARKDLPEACEKLSTFKRRGLEFKLEDFYIFLEEVEGLPPSLEIVSPLSLKEVKGFMDSMGVRKYFTQSVPELVYASLLSS
ncbi:MAG: hypothetical protein GY915_06745 [bacterium]|nr:hypothetical protein [bacterium]